MGEPAGDAHGVTARMQAIETSLPRTDGVGYFNRLYLAVTRAVHEDIDGRPTFEDPDFLARLDVFANFLLRRLRRLGCGMRLPGCLAAALRRPRARLAPPDPVRDRGNERAHQPRPPPGRGGHLRGKWARAREGLPQYRDFERVNKLLSGVEGRVRRWFESGLIADLNRLTGDKADALAMWSISDARELAWDQAETLWKLRDHPDIAVPYEDALSRLVELGGRGILL